MGIPKDDAFRDMRNAAELLLAPRVPKSRTAVNTSSLRLNLGSGVALPGVINDPTQISGPIRSAFSDVLSSKAFVRGLSSAVTGVLTAFDATRTALASGRTITAPALVTPNTAIGHIPSVEQFLTFSSLAPGQPIPASFGPQLDERKAQLQQLARSFSLQSNNPGFGGVTIVENVNPEPYPHHDELDLPSLPRLAQGGSTGQNDPILKDKVKFAVKGVKIGSGRPSFWSRMVTAAAAAAAPGLNSVVNQLFRDRKNEGTWSEPVSPYAAQYPFNKVQQTESGHVIELDDTPGAERVHVFHRSGSFIEFHPNGTVVYKNMKDGYHITMNDQYVKINGKCHIAVDGATAIYVKGNVDLQTDGDFNAQVKGAFNVYAQNINLRAKKTFKADGLTLDLRYMTLPGTPPGFVTPMGGGPFFTPRLNLTALKTDFPDANWDAVASGSKSMVPQLTAVLLDKQNNPLASPPENPLSNPTVYAKQTPRATIYRTHLFDTPEEVNDFELYTSHLSLQQTLKDTNNTARQLGGTLRTITTNVIAPVNKPSVNYLNFDDFKGKYDYPPDFALGGTSFTLQDLVDLSLYPDVITDTSNSTTGVEGVPSDAVPTTPDPNSGGSSTGPDHGNTHSAEVV